MWQLAGDGRQGSWTLLRRLNDLVDDEEDPDGESDEENGVKSEGVEEALARFYSVLCFQALLALRFAICSNCERKGWFSSGNTILA